MKTTSLELSKQLKAAGAKQDAQYFWAYQRRKWEIFHEPYFRGDGSSLIANQFSSFDCHELLEGLPEELCCSVQKLKRIDGGKYYACDGGYCCTVYEDTPAEALGKLKLWCLENGHCEKE